MLRYALIFFIVGLIAALLGFTDIATAAAGIAQILFYIFIALFVVSILLHIAGKGDRMIKFPKSKS